MQQQYYWHLFKLKKITWSHTLNTYAIIWIGFIMSLHLFKQHKTKMNGELQTTAYGELVFLVSQLSTVGGLSRFFCNIYAHQISRTRHLLSGSHFLKDFSLAFSINSLCKECGNPKYKGCYTKINCTGKAHSWIMKVGKSSNSLKDTIIIKKIS